MKIYTRTGDDGTTSLPGGRRIPKHHLRVEAYGTVDELIAWIGLLRDHKENCSHAGQLLFIQNQLMTCAGAIAGNPENAGTVKSIPGETAIKFLEEEIDKMEEELPPLKGFIIPGGHFLVSYCHIARCVCRRAERAVWRLANTEKTPETVAIFLNRLSDYLFVLSRYLSLKFDI